MTVRNERGFKAQLTAHGWVVKYRTAPGVWTPKRVPKDIRSEAAAIAFVEAWVASTRDSTSPKDAPTLASLVEKWLARREAKRDRGELAPATVRADRYNVHLHVLKPLGSIPLTAEAFRPVVLREWLRALKAKRAALTVRNIVNTLTMFLHDGLAEEWIELPANPMEHPLVREEIPIGRTKAGRRIIIHLSLRQLSQLVSCAKVPEEWRLRYLLGGLTGLDDGELAGLQWDDLDLDADVPQLEVKRALRMVGAKGKPELGPPKRESRYRVVPLHREAARALRAWRAGGVRVLLGHKAQPADAVLPSPIGKHWRPKSGARIRTHLKMAGAMPTYQGHPITFKALRRSFATWLEAEDVPRDRRDRLMGHAPDGVGPTHYTHTELRKLAEAVDLIKIDVAFGEVVELPLRAAKEA